MTNNMKSTSDNVKGIGFIVLAMIIFSLQNIAVKSISGDYPVLEIVIFRSVVALPFAYLFFRLEGGRGLPTSQQPTLEYVRGFVLFVSYTTYFMGLAALPLASASAIRFSAPLMITVMSVLWLRERVKLYQWLAVIVGFIGVLFIVRPGTATFNIGSIFILSTALTYSINVMITRRLRTTESSATMAYYSTVVYLIAGFVLAPLVTLIGEVPDAHPSIAFLLHSWQTPTLFDLFIMSGLGLVWASGMYCMARGYSLALASAAAPFEYVGLPINATWGFLIWREVPILTTWIGAALTIGSGLYILYRERRAQSAPSGTSNRRRLILSKRRTHHGNQEKRHTTINSWSGSVVHRNRAN